MTLWNTLAYVHGTIFNSNILRCKLLLGIIIQDVLNFPLLSCIAALLGAQVILTDLPDRLRLLRKNIETNTRYGNMRGSATVRELTWGYDPDTELIEPLPDYGTDKLSSLSTRCSDYSMVRFFSPRLWK